MDLLKAKLGIVAVIAVCAALAGAGVAWGTSEAVASQIEKRVLKLETEGRSDHDLLIETHTMVRDLWQRRDKP